MSKYTFTFKKGDIFVEFTTDDKIIVARQFPKWVEAADAYKRQHSVSGDEKKNPAPVDRSLEAQKLRSSEVVEASESDKANEMEQGTEDAKMQKCKDAELSDAQDLSYSEEQSEKEETVNREQETEDAEMQGCKDTEFSEIPSHFEAPFNPSTEESQPSEQPIAEIVDEIAENATEVFDKASSLLKTINTIQNPEPEIIQEPEVVDFDKVLEEKIENPTFEPSRTTDEKFLEIFNSKNPQDKLQKFVITAYYLLEFEKMERFSIKQINAKLMQNVSELVDHTILQEAFDKHLVEVVPDLTGMAEIGEYKLTNTGEAFFTGM